MISAITGNSFGDEGKGKMTDLLVSKADIVVRFQGGEKIYHKEVKNSVKSMGLAI